MGFLANVIVKQGRKPQILGVFESMLLCSKKNNVEKEIKSKIMKTLFDKKIFLFITVKIFLKYLFLQIFIIS